MAAPNRPDKYHATVLLAICCPFWNGINTLSTSGIVRYGGTWLAAVPSSISAKPQNSCPRYGLAKRHRRNSVQVDGGVWTTLVQTGHSSWSGSSGALQLGHTFCKALTSGLPV